VVVGGCGPSRRGTGRAGEGLSSMHRSSCEVWSYLGTGWQGGCVPEVRVGGKHHAGQWQQDIGKSCQQKPAEHWDKATQRGAAYALEEF